jgi:hypothetical protein
LWWEVLQAVPGQGNDGEQAAIRSTGLVEDQGKGKRQYQAKAKQSMRETLRYFDLTDNVWPWILVATLVLLALLT